MDLDELSNILWKERQLLELLLFKLEEEQLILAAGASRWLAHATNEVEVVLEELRTWEVLRATTVQSLSRRLGFGDTLPRLTELAERTPPPWDRIFRDHRAAFLSLAAEVNAVAAANKNLLTRAHQATHDTLAWLMDADPELYSGQGGVSTGGPKTHLFDEVL